MRAVFVTYLLVIVTGLVLYAVIGLTHNQMRAALRSNALSLVFLLFFVMALAGQAFAG